MTPTPPGISRLRLMLLLFFFALAVPALVLTTRAYRQLKWETLHLYRQQAEEFSARINQQINRWIHVEEQRPFTDYSFLNLAGDPAANFVQRSPLATLPVPSDWPGAMGYFQIDPRGHLSTPLLPVNVESLNQVGLTATDLERRRAIEAQLRQVLATNALLATRPALARAGEPRNTPSRTPATATDSDPSSRAEVAAADLNKATSQTQSIAPDETTMAAGSQATNSGFVRLQQQLRDHQEFAQTAADEPMETLGQPSSAASKRVEKSVLPVTPQTQNQIARVTRDEAQPPLAQPSDDTAPPPAIATTSRDAETEVKLAKEQATAGDTGIHDAPLPDSTRQEAAELDRVEVTGSRLSAASLPSAPAVADTNADIDASTDREPTRQEPTINTRRQQRAENTRPSRNRSAPVLAEEQTYVDPQTNTHADTQDKARANTRESRLAVYSIPEQEQKQETELIADPENPPANDPTVEHRLNDKTVGDMGDTNSIQQQNLQVYTFESIIDPFQFSRLQSGHFILFRQVWHDNQRFFQGLLLDPQQLIDHYLATEFHGTTLSTMSNVHLRYQGQPLYTLTGGAGGYRSRLVSRQPAFNGETLLTAQLSPPLSELDLQFTVRQLPGGPGASIVVWSGTTFILILCIGCALMYRTGRRQIELARQQQDFVAAVSHELKTPLTSIRMYGEMLQSGWVTDDKKQQYYQYIHDESERLSRLIDNVLQLARMNRSELQLNLQTVEIATVLDIIRSKVMRGIEQAGFEFDLICAQALYQRTIRVDLDALTQVIINIVDNALKFSAKASRQRIEIHILASATQQQADQQLTIQIRDHGPGIPRDQLKKIFHLFYRSENELTRETVGTGIGLALVHQLMQAMGGHVSVANNTPGVTFSLHFPQR